MMTRCLNFEERELQSASGNYECILIYF